METPFPEVNFNEKFIGELCIDLGDDIQSFSMFLPSRLRLRLALPRNNDVDVVNSVAFGVLD